MNKPFLLCLLTNDMPIDSRTVIFPLTQVRLAYLTKSYIQNDPRIKTSRFCDLTFLQPPMNPRRSDSRVDYIEFLLLDIHYPGM